MSDPSGVVFPLDPASGRRSTTATGRAVVADALRGVDPVGAASAERETNWRQGYLPHFRRLVEAGVAAPGAAQTIAVSGLDSLHRRMRWADASGDHPLDVALASAQRAEPMGSETIRGEGTPCAVASTSGSTPAPSSPPALLPWAVSSTTPTGSTSQTAPWSCSGRLPRWGHCAPCSGGEPTSRPSTFPEKICGTG